MKIGIIGSGRVGGALGRHWAEAGHEIVFGSRQPQGEKVQALVKSIGAKACADTIAATAAWAEVVVLAVPWSTAQEALKAAGSLAGKVLIDCTNPIVEGGKLGVGWSTSGGETVAGWASGARVVKAFNTTGAENMENPVYGGKGVSMFYCGDDAEAKAVAARLISEVGFEPVDSGGLAAARYLEPLTALWVSLARSGLGRNIAITLVKR